MKVIKAYITPNNFSRTQKKLKARLGLCIHWFANPMSTGMANRNFFENRKLGKTSYGAAHDIVDLNGDLINVIPYDEEAYQVGSDLPYKSGSNQVYTPLAWSKLNTNTNKNVKPYPNNCLVGIECAHLDWDGNMTKETAETLFQWCVDRCKEFNLTADDIYTHQEVVGWKDCHRYFVQNPTEWIKFKNRVRDALNPIKVEVKPVSPITPQEDEEEMKEQLEALIKRIEELELSTKVLEKTVAPDWFTKEFGTDEITEFVKDASGDADFWRNFAVMIRYFQAKK